MGRTTYLRISALIVGALLIIVLLIAGGYELQRAVRTKWRFQTAGWVHGAPAIIDSVVYFGNRKGQFFAVDADSGQELWHFNTDGGIDVAPIVVDGIVYFGIRSGYGLYPDDYYLYALDAQTGHELWRLRRGRIGFSPTIADGVIYFGPGVLGAEYAGSFYAVDAKTGQEIWRSELPCTIHSRPSLAGGLVYFTCSDNYLHALDTQTGQERWRFKFEGAAAVDPLLVIDGTVYFYTGTLYAVDAQTGRGRWQDHPSSDASTGPTDKLLYFTAGDVVYGIDRETGETRWNFKPKGSAFNPPTVNNGVVYFGGTEGRLYALDAETGGQRWSYNALSLVDLLTEPEFTPNPMFSPTVADGVVYIGAWDNYLYAIYAD